MESRHIVANKDYSASQAGMLPSTGAVCGSDYMASGSTVYGLVGF